MRTAGLVLILVMGGIHAREAPECFEFATCLGALLVANTAGAVVWPWGSLGTGPRRGRSGR